jgi:hypothetical protein
MEKNMNADANDTTETLEACAHHHEADARHLLLSRLPKQSETHEEYAAACLDGVAAIKERDALKADNDRLRGLLLEAQSGGDVFRAPQDWWARVALAGPESGEKACRGSECATCKRLHQCVAESCQAGRADKMIGGEPSAGGPGWKWELLERMLARGMDANNALTVVRLAECKESDGGTPR